MYNFLCCKNVLKFKNLVGVLLNKFVSIIRLRIENIHTLYLVVVIALYIICARLLIGLSMDFCFYLKEWDAVEDNFYEKISISVPG